MIPLLLAPLPYDHDLFVAPPSAGAAPGEPSAGTAPGQPITGTAPGQPSTGTAPVGGAARQAPAGPYYRLADGAPVGDWDPRQAPDVLRLPADGRWISLPLTGAAEAIVVQAAGWGALDARGIAAEGELVYADGRTQGLKWMVGEELWPAYAGATGRFATPVPFGHNPSGDELSLSELRVPTSWPATPLRELRLRRREAGLEVGIVAVGGDAWPGLGHTGEGPGWFPWRMGLSQPLPALTPNPCRGPLRAEGEALRCADGAEARLWGVNLVGKGALPPDPERFAERLAFAGVDLVRLHHLDQDGVLYAPGGRPAPDPAALDRLDRFGAALEARGIFVVVEAMTRRSYVGEPLPHPEDVPVGNKYVGAAWPAYLEAEEAQLAAIWGRTNPYTGRRWADAPNVALVELLNENSLVVAWSGANLERLPAPHRRRLDLLWNRWLRQKYATDARLAAAWQGRDRAGLGDGETLVLESVAREPTHRTRADLYPTARSADLVAFYAALDADHHRALAARARSLGFRQPLVCDTSFGLPHADALLTACDVVDLHLYWDPIAESTAFQDVPLLRHPRLGRFLEKLASCPAGAPCYAGELQHSWPNRFLHEAPLVWAALGARQGWAGLTWFAWSHDVPREAPDGPNGALDLEGRWSHLLQVPAARALYRSLPAAVSAWVRAWSPDGLARDLAEQPALWSDAAAWPSSYLARRVRTSFAGLVPGAAVLPAEAPPVRWDMDRGRLLVATPAVDALVGDLASGARAGSLEAAVSTWAAVSLTRASAGDGTGPGAWLDPGALLVATGRTERAGTVWNAQEQGLLVLGRGAAGQERLRGTIWLTGRRPRAWALDGEGRPTAEVALRRDGRDRWALVLDEADTPWWWVR